MKMYKILLVEDDKNIGDMVYDYLTSELYEVEHILNGWNAVKTFKKKEFDLVLLDLMLPDCSGMEVIKAIRKISTVPIIIVTAKNSDVDKTIGLNLGADDYVTKPFSLIELSARIKANIRRVTKYMSKESVEDDIIRYKDLEINISQHNVKRKDVVLNLTYTEFEILKLLVSNLGRAFSKEQIYNIIWKETYYGNENVLNSHMNRLRNKLREEGTDSNEYIKTLWGIGYKMGE